MKFYITASDKHAHTFHTLTLKGVLCSLFCGVTWVSSVQCHNRAVEGTACWTVRSQELAVLQDLLAINKFLSSTWLHCRVESALIRSATDNYYRFSSSFCEL